MDESKELRVPFRYAIVNDGLYRGAYPTLKNFRFLLRLRLKTIVSLIPETPNADLIEFCRSEHITLYHFVVEKYSESVTIQPKMMAQILEILIRRESLPCYVHCLDGANVTGLVMMCLRKLQHFALNYAFTEFYRFVRGAAGDAGGVVVPAEKEFVRQFGSAAQQPVQSSTQSGAAAVGAGTGGGGGGVGGLDTAGVVVRLPTNPMIQPTTGQLIQTAQTAQTGAINSASAGATEPPPPAAATGSTAPPPAAAALTAASPQHPITLSAAPIAKWLWGGRRLIRHPTIRIADPAMLTGTGSGGSADSSSAAAGSAIKRTGSHQRMMDATGSGGAAGGVSDLSGGGGSGDASGGRNSGLGDDKSLSGGGGGGGSGSGGDHSMFDDPDSDGIDRSSATYFDSLACLQSRSRASASVALYIDNGDLDRGLARRANIRRIDRLYSTSLHAMALEGLTMRSDHATPLDPGTGVKFTAK